MPERLDEWASCSSVCVAIGPAAAMICHAKSANNPVPVAWSSSARTESMVSTGPVPVWLAGGGSA